MNPILSTVLEGAWLGLLVAAGFLAALPWISRHGPLRPAVVAVAMVLTVRYLYWRATATIPPIDQPLDFAAGVLFFAVELAALIGTLLSLFALARWRSRTAEVDANRPWLWSKDPLPLVDVFICTYNEEREILERTMIGATRMDYPNYRVWVLDDGRRPWLKDFARQLGCEYLTRPDNSHAKAGNINHALAHVAALERRPDFISILDADFVCTRKFLSRALTLFRNEDVGVVQTPQHFTNPDPIQANLTVAESWPDEQRYFFDIVMPSKDAWGTAFCCGTSSVIRFAALEKTGGFPTDSVTEDYLLTIRMRQAGYCTVYLNERLTFGLAPEGLKEYVTQRSRWCLGFIQIFVGPDGPLRPNNGLRLLDRMSLVESFLYWSAAYLFRMAGFVVPVLYLVLDIHAVDVSVVEGVLYFLPYYVAQITVIAWLSGQRVLPVMTDISQLLAAREILTAVVVGLFKPKGHKFKVTAKGGDRSTYVVQWQLMGTFLTLLLMTIYGVMTAFWFDTDRALQDSSVVALFWSWYNILVLLTAMAVCVERPRYRRDERLSARDTITLSGGGGEGFYSVLDVSAGGLRLRGPAPVDVGGIVTFDFGGGPVNGTVVRKTPADFAVRAEDTLDARVAMIQHVYASHNRAAGQQVKPTGILERLVIRLFA